LAPTLAHVLADMTIGYFMIVRLNAITIEAATPMLPIVVFR